MKSQSIAESLAEVDRRVKQNTLNEGAASPRNYDSPDLHDLHSYLDAHSWAKYRTQLADRNSGENPFKLHGSAQLAHTRAAYAARKLGLLQSAAHHDAWAAHHVESNRAEVPRINPGLNLVGAVKPS